MVDATRPEQNLIAPELVLERLETLRVVSDPLRLRLLERLALPRTVKELAAELGLAPTKLYYHVGLLERHGLLRVVDTRLVSGIIEKRYQVTARRLRVAPHLLTIAVAGDRDDGAAGLLTTVFANTEAEIAESLRRGAIDPDSLPPQPDALLFVRTNGKLPPERAEEFFARLKALVDEFERTDREPAESGSRPYGMTLALYPMVTGQDPGKSPSAPETG